MHGPPMPATPPDAPLRGATARASLCEMLTPLGAERIVFSMGGILSFAAMFLREAANILAEIDAVRLEAMAEELASLRNRGGRLFVLGVGGSAGHASHAVNDFRKICGIEAYAPTDNVSELTARTNDEGWETVFSGWLRVSRLSERDALLVFSVSGGSLQHNVSTNLVHALHAARECNATILGIVGRDGGFTAKVAKVAIVIPPLVAARVTPHTEGLAAVVWHLLVSHPAVQQSQTKWESLMSLP